MKVFFKKPHLIRSKGEFVNDQAHGFGVYIHKNGFIYEGYWKDGVQHGKGSEKYRDGSTFDGLFKFGKKEGKGIFKWANGSVYKGDFHGNKRTGKVFNRNYFLIFKLLKGNVHLK